MGENRPFIEFLYKFKASPKASRPIEFNMHQKYLPLLQYSLIINVLWVARACFSLHPPVTEALSFLIQRNLVPTFSTYWNFLSHQVELLVSANGKNGSS